MRGAKSGTQGEKLNDLLRELGNAHRNDNDALEAKMTEILPGMEALVKSKIRKDRLQEADVEDIFGEVLVQLARDAWKMADGNDVKIPLGWFWGLVSNCVKNHFRKKRKKEKLASDCPKGTLDRIPDPNDRFVERDLRDNEKLLVEEGLLFRLRLSGFTLNEIAEKLSVSEATVRRRLSDVQKLLKKKGGFADLTQRGK